ncbi:MAG: glycosyltransferase, partial [Pricia sp.]|nr:glycosyltransferase [Pricia sp.]
FYGRIHPDKGTLEAIEIAKQVGCRLKIAGHIQDQEYFKRQISPRLDNQEVEYIGNVGQTEGNLLLGNAKALLHPVRFDEPFGLSVAETMMCGTPVIAFNRGSMPELIEEGKTGFLVNTVSEAVESIKKLNQIDPVQCRAHALAKFSIERMIGQYIEVYEAVHSQQSQPHV